jgi:hypothetical protein
VVRSATPPTESVFCLYAAAALVGGFLLIKRRDA